MDLIEFALYFLIVFLGFEIASELIEIKNILKSMVKEDDF